MFKLKTFKSLYIFLENIFYKLKIYISTRHHTDNGIFSLFRLPSPYNKQSSGVGCAGGGPGSGTSIPLPATVAATRRCPPDKVRPAPAPTHQSQLGKFYQLISLILPPFMQTFRTPSHFTRERESFVLIRRSAQSAWYCDTTINYLLILDEIFNYCDLKIK